MSFRRIVYIRATDRRPLYIFTKGRFCLITTFFALTEDGQLIEGDPGVLRVGDVVRVRYSNPRDGRMYAQSVDIDEHSWFSDEPRIEKRLPNCPPFTS